jgi:hypothetical protein
MENSNMNWMMQKLYPHVGHDVVCVAYGDLLNQMMSASNVKPAAAS